jgi:hypothetical protein
VSPRAGLECRFNYSDILLSCLLSGNVGFEILTAVSMRSTAAWDVTQNSLVAVQRQLSPSRES